MQRTVLLAALLGLAPAAAATSPAGLWDATIVVQGITIPFRFEISGAGSSFKGSFFNGDEKVTSTSAHASRSRLTFAFAYYGSKLELTSQAGALDGTYYRMGKTYPVHAVPFRLPAEPSVPVPAIAGLWEIEAQSTHGDNTWRMLVRQSGPEVSASILRVDGDTGALSGGFRDGKFVLSHFSGARPSVFEVTAQPDGTLRVAQNGAQPFTAVRPADARAKGLPEPTDPTRYTSVKDPAEPFHFRFPDLDGRMVADTDARFHGKVVIVTIGGSWCPNCHDEAPFLMDLYRRFHGQGLEIVDLSFEEADVLAKPDRVRAFIRKFGIEYTVLLPGETTELESKLPQAVNLHAFPTTFFLGRDGRVRAVHAGFSGAAMGDLHRELKEETTALVKRLLSETPPHSDRPAL